MLRTTTIIALALLNLSLSVGTVAAQEEGAQAQHQLRLGFGGGHWVGQDHFLMCTNCTGSVLVDNAGAGSHVQVYIAEDFDPRTDPLINPVSIMSQRADMNGFAEASYALPPSLAGLTIRIQAFADSGDSFRTSRLLRLTFARWEGQR